MKSNLKAAVRILAALAALTTALHVRAATEIVPLILVDEVPLPDAILNLARQINLNCIIDPCVPGSYFGDGRKVRAPEVSFRFENRTVEDVLEFVTTKYKLTIITNHATTVARIVPLNHRVRPVPSTPELSDSNGILPTIFLNGVTVVEAIKEVAKAAGLRAVFDRRVTASEYGENTTTVFRWSNITPGQALAALLDNFDLVMKKESADGTVRISLKEPEGPDPHGRGGPKR